MEACLYVVATPIGNLDDMTLRASKILAEVSLIAAEDTRRAKQLLSHLNIDKKEIISYFDHVEQSKAPVLVQRMKDEGLQMALISDAGTPCVSDPGFRLVAEAHKEGVKVVPLPGASALTALVSASGLPSDRFTFIGFLPSKDGSLKDEIQSWLGEKGSIVFYESTRRLKKSLNTISRTHESVMVAVGRELTKLHEEVRMFPIADAISWCEGHETLKGEVAVMLSGFGEQSADQDLHGSSLEERIREDLAQGKRFKEVLKAYKDSGLSRQELYQLVVKLKEQKNES